MENNKVYLLVTKPYSPLVLVYDVNYTSVLVQYTCIINIIIKRRRQEALGLSLNLQYVAADTNELLPGKLYVHTRIISLPLEIDFIPGL